jgi:hypothetical protein
MRDNQDIILKESLSLFREHFTGLCYFARQYTHDSTQPEIAYGIHPDLGKPVGIDWENPQNPTLFTSVENRA